MAEEEFAYLNTKQDKAGLWDYFESTGHGFSILPFDIAGEDGSIRITEDIYRLRKKLKQNEITSEEARAALKKELEVNPCGFLYYCLAFSRSGREAELASFLQGFIGDDPTSNFVILYGLLVSNMATKMYSEEYLKAFDGVISAAAGKQIIKTISMPDIVDALKKTRAAMKSSNG